MTPIQRKRTNWGKVVGIIGGSLAAIASAYGIISHVMADIKANKDAIIKQAKDDATRQADRNAYRLRIEKRFEDDEKRIKELEDYKSRHR